MGPDYVNAPSSRSFRCTRLKHQYFFNSQTQKDKERVAFPNPVNRHNETTPSATESGKEPVAMAEQQISTTHPLPPAVLLPVEGDQRAFPVRRVYCVGRNYADHALEMGGDPTREPPFFFQKNPDNLVPPPGDFPYPGRSNDVHHEVELFVALKSGGENITEAQALDHVFGYGVAIDFTRRDRQAEVKKAGRSWEVAKAFEHSAPCSAVIPASRIGHPTEGHLWLDVNGVRRQSSDIGKMIWRVPEIIAALSSLFRLAAGDVILTGTPAGVGPVLRGDRLSFGLDGTVSRDLTVI